MELLGDVPVVSLSWDSALAITDHGLARAIEGVISAPWFSQGSNLFRLGTGGAARKIVQSALTREKDRLQRSRTSSLTEPAGLTHGF